MKIFAGGAVQGLVAALTPRFEAVSAGFEIECTFGPVGAIKAKLEAGEAADGVILTAAAVKDLLRARLVLGASVTDIGTVMAAMAVRAGDEPPSMESEEDLRAAISGAGAIHFPDPKQATSGIHFAEVIGRLELGSEVRDRFRIAPNGAQAMKDLAASNAVRPIGCTQTTEILAVPGVTLAGPPPPGFDLATVYTAAICAQATHSEAAATLTSLLSSDDARTFREQAGFAASRAGV